MSSLANFAEIVKRANEEKRLREAVAHENKMREVVPLLSDMFSMVGKAKIKPIEKFIEKEGKIVSLVSELEARILETEEKLSQVEESNKAPEPAQLEKKFANMFSRLQSDMQTLKRYVDQKPSTTIVNSGGGGEVRVLRMDDVDKSGLVDGATLVWDATLNKFKMVVPDSANLDGGTTNQVLVKVSDTDKDYEWQDMVLSTPEYTRLIDQVDPNTMYIGESTPSTEVCDIGWRIKKVTQAGDDISIVWANGNTAFDKVWDSRITYTYSTECTP